MNKDLFFTGGATTSQAIDAEDENHFENTSFKLKRTRSLGLLDEFIVPMSGINKNESSIGEPTDENSCPAGDVSNHGAKDSEHASNSAEINTLEDFKESDGKEIAKSNEIDASDNEYISYNDYESLKGKSDLNLKDYLNLSNDDIKSGLNSSDQSYSSYSSSNPNSATYDSLAKDTTISNNFNSNERNSNSSTSHDEEFSKNQSSETNNRNSHSSHTNDIHFDNSQIKDDTLLISKPSTNVDYLSHNWKEQDISKSWRYIILRRKNVANSARLENASWRTWAQQRYGLSVVSPESVNWLKESDVTWLYGPIYIPSDSATDAPTHRTTDDVGTHTVDESFHAKPILKKRTIQEIMLSQSNLTIPKPSYTDDNINRSTNRKTNGSPILENINVEDRFNDYGMVSERLNAQYKKSPASTLTHGASSLSKGSLNATSGKNLNSLAFDTNVKEAQEKAAKEKELNDLKEKEIAKKNRRIHFNDVVEQYITIHYDDPQHPSYFGSESHVDLASGSSGNNSKNANNDYEEDADDESSDDDDDDEGGFFLNIKNPSIPSSLANSASNSSANLNGLQFQKPNSGVLNLTGNNSTNSIRTIKPLPSKPIKFSSDSDSQENDSYIMSHNHRNRGYDYHYDYNSVYVCDDSNFDQFNRENSTGLILDEGVNVLDVPKGIELGSAYDDYMPTSSSQNLQSNSSSNLSQGFQQMSQKSLQQADREEEERGIKIPKQNPLPPTTNTRNASGKIKTFLLDSDSDEFIEDAEDKPVSHSYNQSPVPSANTNTTPQQLGGTNSDQSSLNSIGYNSLNEVAVKNNIKDDSLNSSSGSSSSNGKLSGIAHLLGGWKNNS